MNLNNKNLVEMWGSFIDWNKRYKTDMPFLTKLFKENKCKNIFDASLGDGVNSIKLINKYNVTSNDIDKLFIKKAKENAKKNNVKLNITNYDWKELNKYIPNNSFDSIICLGNSLTYLFTKKDQLKVLKNFKNILRKGGLLVIDERNYKYILDNKKKILNGYFKYSSKYVYCGKKIHGYPVKINNKLVRMEYSDETNGKKAYLELYPFKKGELKSLLKEAGFKKIQQFSDYKEGYSLKADFHQYICMK